MATKQSVLRTVHDDIRRQEKYLVPIDPELRKNIEASDSQPKPRRFIPRHIDHPLFKNISSEEAIEYLKNKNEGEVVIRPSAKGTNHLTITWKFHKVEEAGKDDIIAHIDVLETNKPNELSLGGTLLSKVTALRIWMKSAHGSDSLLRALPVFFQLF